MAKVEATFDEDSVKEMCQKWGKEHPDWHKKNWKRRGGVAAGGGAVWFLGFIGALIYFWQHANTFWSVIVGFLQALVWPAYFVYHIFGFLKI